MPPFFYAELRRTELIVQEHAPSLPFSLLSPLTKKKGNRHVLALVTQKGPLPKKKLPSLPREENVIAPPRLHDRSDGARLVMNQCNFPHRLTCARRHTSDPFLPISLRACKCNVKAASIPPARLTFTPTLQRNADVGSNNRQVCPSHG